MRQPKRSEQEDILWQNTDTASCTNGSFPKLYAWEKEKVPDQYFEQVTRVLYQTTLAKQFPDPIQGADH